MYHEIRETLRLGSIGTLGTITATMSGNKGLFRDGTHVIDAICFFAESDPVKISGILDAGFDSWDIYRGESNPNSDLEPGAVGIIEFANGIKALYCGTGGMFPGTWFQISGTAGQVNLDAWEQTAQITTGFIPHGDYQRRNLVARPFQLQRLTAAYQELIDLIEHDGEGVSSGREALKTLQIILGFLKSNQQGGRLIPIPEFD